MKIYIFIRNVLFASLLLYFGLGLFSISGGLISQLLLFIYLLVSAFFGVKFILQKEKNKFGNLLLFFLIVNILSVVSAILVRRIVLLPFKFVLPPSTYKQMVFNVNESLPLNYSIIVQKD